LLKLAERTIVDDKLLGREDFVLVAVSGGPDSMALLHVLVKLSTRLGFRVAAHGIDHGLRAAAAEELALARRFALEVGVPFTSTATISLSHTIRPTTMRVSSAPASEASCCHWRFSYLLELSSISVILPTPPSSAATRAKVGSRKPSKATGSAGLNGRRSYARS